MKLGSSGDQTTIKPYFYTASPLVLLPTLPDVSQDAKRQLAAESLMTPTVVTVPITSALKDGHFTKKIFADPVITAAGDTYEREQIETWLKDHDTNPLDNERLEDKTLRPNKTKMREVNEFLEQNANLRNSDELYLPRGWVRELEQACMEGKLEVIKRWCDRDPRLSSWTFSFEEKEYEVYRGKTMLHLACAKGTLAAVNHLLTLEEKRAEGLGLLLLLKKDSTGKLPIHYAMTTDRDPQMMRQLAVQMGKHLVEVAPVDLPTMPGEKQRQMTALHLAVMNNDVETIMTLLRNKVDLTVKDSEGNTALHAAVACGAGEAITLLIKAGASSEVKNDAYQTPELVGTECKQTAAVEMLKKSIAELVQQQQSQLQQAGPVGIVLSQMQQAMVKLQSLVKAQAAEIEKLRAMKAEQDRIIKQQQAEQIKLREEKTSMDYAVLHTELYESRVAMKCVQKQLKHMTRNMSDDIQVQEIIEFIRTPIELRRALIAALPVFPWAKSLKMILHDQKEDNLELKQVTTILDNPIIPSGISQLIASLPNGRLVIRGNTGHSYGRDYLAVIHIPSHIRLEKITDLPLSSSYKHVLLSNNKVVGQSSGNVNQLAIWDFERETYQELKCSYEAGFEIAAFFLLRDGRLIVNYRKFDSGTQTHTLKVSFIDVVADRSTTLAFDQTPYIQAVTADGQFLIGIERDHRALATLAVWEVNSGKRTMTLAEFKGGPGTSDYQERLDNLTITAHGYLFIKTWQGRPGFVGNAYLKTFDIAKGICIATTEIAEDNIGAFLALTNGYVMYFCGKQKNILKVWDVLKGVCIASISSFDEFLYFNVTSGVKLLPDGRVFIILHKEFRIYQIVGRSIELEVSFRVQLLESDPSWTVGADHIQIKTSFPCESEFKALSTLLERACSDHQLTMALTSTSLTITGLSTELRSDLEELCQALSIPKATPGTQATMSGIASLLSRPGGLYAPLPTLSGRPVSGVTTPTTVLGVSSSSTSTSSSTISSSPLSTILS